MPPKRAHIARTSRTAADNDTSTAKVRRSGRNLPSAQTHDEHTGEDDEDFIEPSADIESSKKVKKGPVRYLCTTCDTNRQAKFFPNYNPTCECEHLINTCTACLKRWVAARVEDGKTIVVEEKNDEDEEMVMKKKGDTAHEDKIEGVKSVLGIRCPECDMPMKNSDVKMAASSKVDERFHELERRHIADSDPSWRWCLNPSCDHGQSHSAPTPPTPKEPALTRRRKAVSKSESQPADALEDRCTCTKCGFMVCVPCDRPWHEGESCAEYQIRVKDRLDEEDRSLALIRKETKNCPRCSKPIEKDGGCPTMYCTQCGSSFCWKCMTNYNTSGLCGCGRVPT